MPRTYQLCSIAGWLRADATRLQSTKNWSSTAWYSPFLSICMRSMTRINASCAHCLQLALPIARAQCSKSTEDRLARIDPWLLHFCRLSFENWLSRANVSNGQAQCILLSLVLTCVQSSLLLVYVRRHLEEFVASVELLLKCINNDNNKINQSSSSSSIRSSSSLQRTQHPKRVGEKLSERVQFKCVQRDTYQRTEYSVRSNKRQSNTQKPKSSKLDSIEKIYTRRE